MNLLIRKFLVTDTSMLASTCQERAGMETVELALGNISMVMATVMVMVTIKTKII